MRINGLPVFSDMLHHVGDLLAVKLARGAARDCEILAGQMHQPAVEGGAAGNDAVGRNFLIGHAELAWRVLREQADLLEAFAIHELSIRSRAVSLPCSCCLSMQSWPPPC